MSTPGKTIEKLEEEAREWIEAITGEDFMDSGNFVASLGDGVLLCKCVPLRVAGRGVVRARARAPWALSPPSPASHLALKPLLEQPPPLRAALLPVLPPSPNRAALAP